MSHDYDHAHGHDAPLPEVVLRVKALEALLTEKGLVDTAALDAAMSRQEPIAVTIWEPSWMMQKYDVKFLADPKGVFPSAQSYYFIGTKGFSEANPAVREQLASIYVPLADITAINGAKTPLEATPSPCAPRPGSRPTSTSSSACPARRRTSACCSSATRPQVCRPFSPCTKVPTCPKYAISRTRKA